METLKDFEKFIATLSKEKFAQLNDAFDVVCSFVPEELKNESIAKVDDKIYDEYYKRWPKGNITSAGRKIRGELEEAKKGIKPSTTKS